MGVAERNFSKTGVAVEVGVFRGDFSKRNLKVWTKKYYQVDAWSFRTGDPEDKNFRHDTVNVANQNAAWRAVAPFEGRVTQMKALSRDAAVKFADSSIDWLYIDRIMTEVFVFRVAHPERPRVHLIVLLGPDFQVSFAEASSKNANFYRDARLREVSFRDPH